MSADNNDINSYKHLPALLHKIRWIQRFAAIIAEALILLAFLASGMDISLGGVMANTTAIKWAWATIFSLGVDTSFVISWVRCRQLGKDWRLLWNIPVALGISFVVFEPVVIQLYQQAMDMNFAQALDRLGIDLTVLVYARSAVAVLLGAILAITNVESGQTEQRVKINPQRKVILFERLLNRVAPIVSAEAPPVQVAVSEEVSEEVKAQTLAQMQTNEDVSEQPTTLLPVVSAEVPAPVAQPEVRTDTTPQERIETVRELDLTGLSTVERVARVLALFPDVSDRELGKLSNVSAATAKKYRETFKRMLTSAPPAFEV
jgi:hypothetical protein